jgi:hypothetical protein
MVKRGLEVGRKELSLDIREREGVGKVGWRVDRENG